VADVISSVAVAQSMVTNNEVSRIDTSSSSRFYSPLVKSIAAQENISLQELEAISGTGAEGRVTKKDILNFIENRTSAPVVAQPTAPASIAGVVTSSSNGVVAAAPAKPAVKMKSSKWIACAV
jgi:2-oxoglutarate dehydrogenase E2 component (dihydrolipoamide succinyltransferase)